MHATHAAGASDADHELLELYLSEYSSLLRLASVLVDDRASCEDIVQEAFARTLLAWRKGRGRAPAATNGAAFVRSAVLNGARSRLRRRSVARKYEPLLANGHDALNETSAGVADHQLIVAEIRRLPDRQREAVALRYYLDLPEAEIAHTLGISAGSVKTHLHRAMQTLARRLEQDR
jgi:RNA polymerase sigma-70 factor (sigma-E family)